MKRSLKSLLAGVGLLLSISLLGTGCSSTNPGMTSNQEGESQLTSNISDGGDSGGKATVTFSAKFPEKGEVVKSLIDDDTAGIDVQWHGSCGEGSLKLTPDNPSGTAVLSPGDCYFDASAYDSAGTELDYSNTAGTLAIGPNTVLITFLKGKWTFVGEDGITPTPVNLNGGESLGGFLLSPFTSNSARKGSIDPGKPYDYNAYSMTWFYSNGDPFKDNTSLAQVSQFRGGTAADSNESVIDGGWYDLTQDMGELEPPTTKGDRFIIIAGGIPQESDNTFNLTFNPDITPYFTSSVVDGKTLSGNLFELTFESESSTIADPPTGVCRQEWEGGSVSSARAAALNRALSEPRKASQSIGQVEASYSECRLKGSDLDGDGSIKEGECEYYDRDGDGDYDDRYCWDQNADGTVDYGEYAWVEYRVTDTFSNVWVHPFVAKGAQLPPTSGEIIVQKK